MGCDRKPKIRIKEQAETVFHRSVDQVCRRWPRPVPPHPLLKSCRLVSHRGEHDNSRCIENTLPAFDASVNAGVWGIEFDVRWTRDRFPVVFHDPDTRRLFKADAAIGQMALADLKEKFPLIPTLAEVVDRYGGRSHLMMEIKSESYPAPSIQSRRMKRLLQHLVPGTDFHLMGIHPELFGYFGFLPARAFLPIARIRIDRISRMAAAHGWGGDCRPLPAGGPRHSGPPPWTGAGHWYRLRGFPALPVPRGGAWRGLDFFKPGGGYAGGLRVDNGWLSSGFRVLGSESR